MSASGLARRSGLDPTTFNKSKRIARDGKPRWPTTESIAKVLNATDSSMSEFVSLMSGEAMTGVVHRIPVIDLALAGDSGRFDDSGRPAGNGWDEVEFPDLEDPHSYALEVSGDAFEPVYGDGDIIVVSPNAAIRRGDRVVVKSRDGEVLVMQLARKTVRKVELAAVNGEGPSRTMPSDQMAWMSRIMWASQ